MATKTKAELTIGFLSFKESYISEVTCIPYESVEVRGRCVVRVRGLISLTCLNSIRLDRLFFHNTRNSHLGLLPPEK